jgi:hypothetical protein
MKTLTSIILVLVLSPVFSIKGNNYDKAMTDALHSMSQAASVEELSLVANQFERIANAENANWLPVYYAGYTGVLMAAMESDAQKKDLYLDLAQQHLDAVENMEHDATERMALQGFLYMIRMSVDPSRGVELGQECAMILNQAYMMNNQNPRAVLMLAQFNHGSAQYMGTDTSEACTMLAAALLLLDQPKHTGADQFLPSWGKDLALNMQNQCQEK